MINETKIQEVKHLLSTGQRASISTKTFEEIIELLEQKEQKIEQVKKFVAGLMFDVDCTNWFERFVVAFEDWKTQLGNDKDKYKKALDDIKEIAGQLYYQAIKDPVKREKAIYSIIDIIDKAKGQ